MGIYRVFRHTKIHSMVGGRLPTRIAVYNDPEVLRINPYYKELLPNFMASKLLIRALFRYSVMV